MQSPRNTEKFKTFYMAGIRARSCSWDGAWEAETRGAPQHLFLPVAFLADAIRTTYMKMGGVWWGSEQRLFTAAPGFWPAPLVPASPWPLSQGGRLKRASAAGSGGGNKEPLVPGSRGKVQSWLPRLGPFSFAFSQSVFLWLWGGFWGGVFLKTFIQEQSSDLKNRADLPGSCFAGVGEKKVKRRLN